MIGTVVAFGTPVTFGTVTLVTLVLHTRHHHTWWVLVHLVHFVICDIWYTSWYTTPLSTPSCFLTHFWHTRMIFGHFRYIWGRCYVWYTSDVWYSNASNIVLHTTHHPWWVLVHLVHFITCDIWYTTPISTPSCFLVHFWHTGIIFGHFQYFWSRCYVW